MKAKAKAKDGLGKAEEVLIPLLEELAEKKPEDLAVILGDDLSRHVPACTATRPARRGQPPAGPVPLRSSVA